MQKMEKDKKDGKKKMPRIYMAGTRFNDGLINPVFEMKANTNIDPFVRIPLYISSKKQDAAFTKSAAFFYKDIHAIK